MDGIEFTNINEVKFHKVNHIRHRRKAEKKEIIYEEGFAHKTAGLYRTDPIRRCGYTPLDYLLQAKEKDAPVRLEDDYCITCNDDPVGIRECEYFDRMLNTYSCKAAPLIGVAVNSEDRFYLVALKKLPGHLKMHRITFLDFRHLVSHRNVPFIDFFIVETMPGKNEISIDNIFTSERPCDVDILLEALDDYARRNCVVSISIGEALPQMCGCDEDSFLRNGYKASKGSYCKDLTSSTEC